MLKLLTEKGWQKVRLEYLERRTVVILSALIIVLVAGIIGLLPSYIISSARNSEAHKWVNIINNSLGSMEGGGELQAWLVETNRRLSVLSPKLDSDRPSELFKKILNQKNNGISLTQLSWTRTSNEVKISISGVARQRQTLVTFEEKLSSSGSFSKVILPISDLAKDKDLDFRIELLPL